MGSAATAIFSIRNIGKVGKGDTGRVGALTAQTTNLVTAASKSNNAVLSKGANSIFQGVDKAGKAVGVSNAATKISNFASKAVNPLLCVAAATRVLKDDDKYAAAIEETAAMGAMFASEKLYKQLIANPMAGKELKSSSKTVTKLASKVDDFAKGLKGKKKVAAVIIADVGLVLASIFGFDLGKKIGKKLSNREETKTPELAQYNINTSTTGVNYKS